MKTNFLVGSCDRTNGFKLKLDLFKGDIREKFFTMRMVKKPEQVSQLGCGCPIPGKIQGLAGLVSEQPGLVEDVSVHCSTRWH